MSRSLAFLALFFVLAHPLPAVELLGVTSSPAPQPSALRRTLDPIMNTIPGAIGGTSGSVAGWIGAVVLAGGAAPSLPIAIPLMMIGGAAGTLAFQKIAGQPLDWKAAIISGALAGLGMGGGVLLKSGLATAALPIAANAISQLTLGRKR